MWLNVTLEFLGVGVAIMDISQHLFLIYVLHAIYNMHESYRKILSHQPIISVKYWQGYDETLPCIKMKSNIFFLEFAYLCVKSFI